jgi:membrane fusion protein, multidrug efflux system
MKLKAPSKLSNFLRNNPLQKKYAEATPLARRMTRMIFGIILLFALIFAFKVITIMMAISSMQAHPNITTISTMEAKYQPWQPKLKATASLIAVKGVDVTSEIAGIVNIIHTKPGADVKQDDLIVELRADSEIAQLHSLQALAELSKTNYGRNKAQFTIRAISKATLDASAADLKSKDAQVVEQAAIVNKKFIRAPFSGRLGVIPINPGQYLKPGDNIVTLQALDPIYVDFFVPQQNMVQLHVGQPVKLSTDTYPKKIFTGNITTINPKVDPNTRNIQIEATITNPNLQLLPGMFGSVEVDTGAPEYYLTLPQTAISYNSYGDIAFIVKSSTNKKGKTIFTVKQTFITVGPTRGDQVAILSGIKAGDLIVVAGQLKLKNNDEVVINNSVLPSNNPAPHPVNE